MPVSNPTTKPHFREWVCGIQNSKLKTQNWGGGREAYAPSGIAIHRIK